MSLTGNTLGYSTEWEPYRKEDGYDKLEYDVMLKDGKIITNCYPNAGFFMPSGEKPKKSTLRHGGWPAEDVDKIRITPHDKQELHINEDSIYN
jgi:hypothetical protein